MNNENNNQNTGSEEQFGLPEGYFQNSAKKLIQKLEWEDEHRPFIVLSGISRKNCWELPQGYFKQSESRLELSEYKKLREIKKDPGFVVLEDYFETNTTVLSINLNRKATQQEETREGFIVADNYFELSAKRLKAGINKKPAKIINLFKPFVSFAAAAILLLVLGWWLYGFYFKPTGSEDCGTIACIDKNEIIKAAGIEGLENEDLYEIVNSEKLKENLDNDTHNSSNRSNADTSKNDDANDEFLDEI